MALLLFVFATGRSFGQSNQSSQVLTNVSVALAAMGIGALGLPLDLANLMGGSMVLIFSLFSRFLLNGSRIPDGEKRRTPRGPAFVGGFFLVETAVLRSWIRGLSLLLCPDDIVFFFFFTECQR